MTAEQKVAAALAVLEEGLAYHEHDGHNMPKTPVRDAVAVLRGKPRDWRPWDDEPEAA